MVLSTFLIDTLIIDAQISNKRQNPSRVIIEAVLGKLVKKIWQIKILNSARAKRP